MVTIMAVKLSGNWMFRNKDNQSIVLRMLKEKRRAMTADKADNGYRQKK